MEELRELGKEWWVRWVKGDGGKGGVDVGKG